MPTKKELKDRFQITENTVNKTLRACGLDISSEEYSEEEIEKFFAPAREMISQGQKYKDVEEHFGVTASTNSDSNEQEDFVAPESVAADATDHLSVATAETVARMVQRGVKEVAPYIPTLVAATINEELRPSGSIRQAFDEMNRQIEEGNTANMSSGASFLLKQVSANRRQSRQLTETPTQKVLPSASDSNSEISSEEQSQS